MFVQELEGLYPEAAKYLERYRNTLVRNMMSIDFDFLDKPSMMEEGDSEDLISKLKADPDNQYVTFDDMGDKIRVRGRQGALNDFILKYEDQDLGQYKLFTTDDDDTGLYVSLSKK